MNTTVSIIGLGYVGLPLSVQFAKAGVTVIGFDTDQKKVDALNNGLSYIKHVPDEDIAKIRARHLFEATNNFERIKDSNAIIICVPTPLGKHKEPDLSYVFKTAELIAPNVKKGDVVVLESTTYPGTTEGELRAILENGSGLTAGLDFHLAFSPEREDPGNPECKLEKIPKVVGGLTPECLKAALAIYSLAINQLVPVSSCAVAEASKLTENIFRSVNIALVNELKLIYERMGIDIWEVIDAAKTKPFGFMPFFPGPGLGGHCIPIDPYYLTWKAREYGLHTRFIELAGEINTAMPEYVTDKVVFALNCQGKAMKDSRVLLLGLAYKPNIADDRESPSYVIMELLEKKGARVSYNDPHIPVIKPTRYHGDLAGRRSVSISNEFDAVVICTAHDEYKLIDFSRLEMPVIDTRNCVSKRNGKYYRA